MATAKDPYSVLGVSRTATADEIKKAYRKLAKKHHPDVNPGDKQAEEKFKEVSAAFEIVGDEKRRKLFDEFGPDALRTGFDPERARQYQRWSSGQGFNAQGAGAQGNPFDQFGGFDDIFEQFFYGGGGQGRQRRRGPMQHPGRDVETEMQVELMTALRGDEIEIRLPWLQNKALKVKVPKGAADGDKLRLQGQGEPSPDGGPAGSLYLVLRVQPHPLLHRDGSDLTLELPITVPEAVQGAQIETPTPHGNVKLKVPAGARGGEKLRLRGKGVQKQDGSAGDLYVVLQVRAPRIEKDDALVETLKARYDDVRADLKL
ncbi:MAG: DnaJ domain-containing protein [Deltaproteobacteria bacterium]|nr:DnaJ domain-containing protein [Deltaproteobacteria bacterium]